MLESAIWITAGCSTAIGFTRYCVSLKDSDPQQVIDVNRRFRQSERPDVPLHLGVTEAGMPPDGIIKTRIAFEQLIGRRHRRHDPCVTDGAERPQARGDRGGAFGYWRTLRTAGCGASSISA